MLKTNFTMLAFRRPRLTQQALGSIGDTLNMTCTIRHQFENREADKETFDVVKAFSLNSIKSWAIYHTMNNMGTGTARNDVIGKSERTFGRGDYLYLSDSDVFFHPRWLETLIDCYEVAWSSGCRVLGGVGHPYHLHGESLGVCSFNVRYAVKEVMAQPLQSMLMRWEVWDKYGPFDDTAPGQVCQGEDVLFTKRIQADGYKVGVVDPALIVNTGITNSFGEKIVGWELVKAQCPAGVICE